MVSAYRNGGLRCLLRSGGQGHVVKVSCHGGSCCHGHDVIMSEGQLVMSHSSEVKGFYMIFKRICFVFRYGTAYLSSRGNLWLVGGHRSQGFGLEFGRKMCGIGGSGVDAGGSYVRNDFFVVDVFFHYVFFVLYHFLRRFCFVFFRSSI